MPPLYSTYLGGNDHDQGNGIAVDSYGNAYITGQTNSLNFPVKNALYPNIKGSQDAFVTKFNVSGSQVQYSTYWGGDGNDAGSGIAVDSTGNAYVTGYTESSENFPTFNAIYPNFMGGMSGGVEDAFVTKLNASGSQVLYSTYFGGYENDEGTGIAVDSAGNTLITGYTESSYDFPIINAIYPDFGGLVDVFVAKLNANGSQVLYSTYLGGSLIDWYSDIAVDSSGNTYITGSTESLNFPVKNALYPNFNSYEDAFVTKINSSGTQVLYSTYLGGNDMDEGIGIAADSAGNAYVTGQTRSSDFPTHAQDATIVSYDSSFNDGLKDAFIAKIADSAPPSPPTISLSPASLSFSNVQAGMTWEQTFVSDL